MFNIQFKRYVRGLKGVIGLLFIPLIFTLLFWFFSELYILISILFLPLTTWIIWLFGEKVFITPSGIKVGKNAYSWGEVRSIQYKEIEGEDTTNCFFEMRLSNKTLRIPYNKMKRQLPIVLEFIHYHQLPISVCPKTIQYAVNQRNGNY